MFLKLALRDAILFLTSLTVFIELPIVIVSLVRSSSLSPVEVFKDHKDEQRSAA